MCTYLLLVCLLSDAPFIFPFRGVSAFPAVWLVPTLCIVAGADIPSSLRSQATEPPEPPHEEGTQAATQGSKKEVALSMRILILTRVSIVWPSYESKVVDGP